MNSTIALPQNAIFQDHDQIKTTSLKVAEAFNKLHKDVLRKLENLECSPEFASAHFYAHEEMIQAGVVKRLSKVYEMTKDGFMFLVMGFTGKKAAAIKEAYINEFNRMAATLNRVTGKTTSEERNGLKNAVNMLVSKKGLLYPEAYAMVHQQFNVSHIDELTRDQLPAAVAYVHNLAMAGEYIQKQEAPALPEIARLDELKGQGQLIAITELELLHIHRLMGRMVLTHKIFNRYELYKVSKALGSRFGGEMIDQVGEGCCDAHKLKHLEPLMSSIYARRFGAAAGSVFG